MYRKLSLVLIALIFVMATFCMPAIAEPKTDNSKITSSSVQDKDNSSKDDTQSGKKDTSSKKNTSSKQDASSKKPTSQYYIADDGEYFTESLNSLGGNVTSGSITLEGSSTVSQEVSSTPTKTTQRFSLQDLLKKFLWMPIVIIIICILVLVIFNKIYELKYKQIDPSYQLKEQKKANERRRAEWRERMMNQNSDEEDSQN